MRRIPMLSRIDDDMPQYIHDNTEDELSHEVFINAYLVAHGAPTVNLDAFRTLPRSKASGAQQIGCPDEPHAYSGHLLVHPLSQPHQEPRLRRYVPTGVPSLAVGRHPAIPRADADLHGDPNFIQAIANTTAFHFATIEQGGTSLYPQLARRVTSVEVLRVLLAIGGTEIMHF